jgi:hypothetical protein
MTTTVKKVMHSYELLSDKDKRKFASEILRRTAHFSLPPPTDKDLIYNAEELFQELDRRESKND